jgi:hypothetical protein
MFLNWALIIHVLKSILLRRLQENFVRIRARSSIFRFLKSVRKLIRDLDLSWRRWYSFVFVLFLGHLASKLDRASRKITLLVPPILQVCRAREMMSILDRRLLCRFKYECFLRSGNHHNSPFITFIYNARGSYLSKSRVSTIHQLTSERLHELSSHVRCHTAKVNYPTKAAHVQADFADISGKFGNRKIRESRPGGLKVGGEWARWERQYLMQSFKAGSSRRSDSLCLLWYIPHNLYTMFCTTNFDNFLFKSWRDRHQRRRTAHRYSITIACKKCRFRSANSLGCSSETICYTYDASAVLTNLRTMGRRIDIA